MNWNIKKAPNIETTSKLAYMSFVENPYQVPMSVSYLQACRFDGSLHFTLIRNGSTLQVYTRIRNADTRYNNTK